MPRPMGCVQIARWVNGSVIHTVLLILGVVLRPYFVSDSRGLFFSVFLRGGNHRIHPILNLADLRMHFLDEVVFDL